MATKKRKKPLGKPLQWTDEDLDTMALVTPQDIENAKAWPGVTVDPLMKALLNADRAPGDNGGD